MRFSQRLLSNQIAQQSNCSAIKLLSNQIAMQSDCMTVGLNDDFEEFYNLM